MRATRPARCRLEAGDFRPWQQLTQPSNSSTGAWLAEGVDPQFRAACRMPAGWFRVRLKLTCPARARLELFADTGCGLDSAPCIERATLRGRLERDFFVNIPHPVRGFRLDPVDVPAPFRLDDVRIEPVTRFSLLREAFAASLYSHGRDTGPAKRLWQNLNLLVRGKVGQLKQNLLDTLSGPSAMAPPGYDAARAYAEWKRKRCLTPAKRNTIEAVSACLAAPPLVSILMHGGQDPQDALQSSLDSVRRQLYPHWELCLGESQPSGVKVSDRRIKTVVATGEDWNTLLSRAKGDFLCLLDAGDELEEDALFRLVATVSKTDWPDMIYSDEELLGPDGPFPFFKPDWSPEYFLSLPYTGRLALYRTDLVRSLGGFRSQYGKAQEHDLVLRIAAQSGRIKHVADVLCRSNSSLASRATAPFRAAAQDHLHSTGRPASVEASAVPGLHRIRFASAGQPMVSIVIPTAYKQRPGESTTYLSGCLASLEKTTYPNRQVLVLDNNEPTSQMMLDFERKGIRRAAYHKPFNWAAAMNQGATLAKGEYLLFLDDDTEIITADWLECLLEYVQQQDIGVVGARLEFPDGRLQHAGVIVNDGTPAHPFYREPGTHEGYFYSNIVPRNYGAVTGACLMTRADVFRAVGGFDESFSTNFNDIDYCLRVIQTGRRIVCTPFARLYHHETATKLEFPAQELIAFQQRWRAVNPIDPYYNPNLCTRFCDFRIRG